MDSEDNLEETFSIYIELSLSNLLSDGHKETLFLSLSNSSMEGIQTTIFNDNSRIRGLRLNTGFKTMEQRSHNFLTSHVTYYNILKTVACRTILNLLKLCMSSQDRDHISDLLDIIESRNNFLYSLVTLRTHLFLLGEDMGFCKI